MLGVSAIGLTVRFLNPAYDPRGLRRAVVVDAGGNGYVYELSRVVVLDPGSGTYALQGAACATPGGQGLRGVGARLARLGSGAALNSFAGGELPGGQFFFQREGEPAETLMSAGAPRLRYAYRAPDGQILYGDAAAPFQEVGGQRYELAGLGLSFEARDGQGPKEARRNLEADLLLQPDPGLGLRRLGCDPSDDPPPLAAGDWRIEIVGLDPGVNASVPISGPGGYRRTLTGSAILRGLRQGGYSLTAEEVAHPVFTFVRYRPTTPPVGGSLGVEVGGANRPTTTVNYTRLPGRLRVEVRGLPAPAVLSAAGTFASYTFSLGNGVHSLPVEAGRYTLSWPELPDPGGRGTWAPDRAGYSVDVPSEGEGDGGVVRYVLRVNPYRLELILEHPGSAPPAEPLVCVQPRDEIQGGFINPDAPIHDCLFRR